MKNIVFSSFLGLLMAGFSLTTFAQNNASKTNDLGRIVLNAYVPSSVDIPESSRNMLANKLNQVATKSGMGGSAVNPRFIITANVSILSKDITPTAPPMTALSLDVTVYVGDVIEGTKFSSASFTVKGTGTNENKAFTQALKQIRPENAAIKRCIMEGKTKIIEYYNSNCDFILKEAEAFTAQNQTEMAILKLMSVPEVCKECYDKCMSSVGPVFKDQIEKTCKTALVEAKNTWAAGQDTKSANEVSKLLSKIDPQSSCYEEASTFSVEVATRIKEIDNREWDFEMKQKVADNELEKASIDAAKEIAVQFANEAPKEKKEVVQEPKVEDWW